MNNTEPLNNIEVFISIRNCKDGTHNANAARTINFPLHPETHINADMLAKIVDNATLSIINDLRRTGLGT